MAFGLNNTNGGNTRGTLQPTNGDRVYVRYTTGATAWVTPAVARFAIERGQAREIKTHKSKKK